MLLATPFRGSPFEGAFAYRPPIGIRFNALYPQITPGPGGQLVAADGGLIVGRFGWANLTTGTAASARSSAQDRLGFVQPVSGSWQYTYYDVWPATGLCVYFLRAGLPAVLYAKGAFYARFAGGAYPGQPVYASSVDGSAISGYAADAEATPWFVNTDAAPGALAIISTWSKYP